jgi:hypothetical protein
MEAISLTEMLALMIILLYSHMKRENRFTEEEAKP